TSIRTRFGFRRSISSSSGRVIVRTTPLESTKIRPDQRGSDAKHLERGANKFFAAGGSGALITLNHFLKLVVPSGKGHGRSGPGHEGFEDGGLGGFPSFAQADDAFGAHETFKIGTNRKIGGLKFGYRDLEDGGQLIHFFPGEWRAAMLDIGNELHGTVA